MKNATELPKYSKSLHFPVMTSELTVSLADEERAKKTPEISRSLMGLAVVVGLGYRF